MGAEYSESFRFKAFLARVFVVVVLFCFKMQTLEALSSMFWLKSSD